jgi:cytochrome c oxidase subunit III
VRPVTRSMEAITPTAAARVARARRTTPSGWWGMALFIATEATLFGTLIASYFYLRLQTVDWPPRGIAAPSVAAPLILTAILVSTTAPMALAVRAARAGLRGAALLSMLGAAAVQAAYLGVQVHFYLSDLDKFSPQDTAYGSVYFALLGLHHAHVLLGILLGLWMVVRLLGGLTNYRLIGVRVVAFYWYFVNALAVLVVATQLSPSW